MSGIKTFVLKATTTGGAGAATGQGRLGIPAGKLVGVQVNYHASAPATTNIVLSNVLDGISKSVYDPAASNTDVALFQPTETLKVVAGTDVPATESPNRGAPVVAGELVLDVATSNALTDAVVLTLLIDTF